MKKAAAMAAPPSSGTDRSFHRSLTGTATKRDRLAPALTSGVTTREATKLRTNAVR
jgi:hypothetical protein